MRTFMDSLRHSLLLYSLPQKTVSLSNKRVTRESNTSYETATLQTIIIALSHSN